MRCIRKNNEVKENTLCCFESQIFKTHKNKQNYK